MSKRIDGQVLVLNRMGFSTKAIAKKLKIPQGSITWRLGKLEEVPANHRNIPFMDKFLETLTNEELRFMSSKMRPDYTAQDLLRDSLKKYIESEQAVIKE